MSLNLREKTGQRRVHGVISKHKTGKIEQQQQNLWKETKFVVFATQRKM